MPASPLPPLPPAKAWYYHFDGVEIDLVARRLRIDGEERPCSQRALQLLELLCAQPGVLLARNHLIDAMWPGGQVVSDEALTQIIFRTRAVLGPYADRLATVRGAGLRLDAQVRRVAAHDAAPAAETPPATVSIAASHENEPPAAAATNVPQRHATSISAPRRRRAGLFALLALATLLAAWQWHTHAPAADTAPIDVGYGLDASDAHASDAQTPARLRDAFRQEAIGDRERARALLEAVHAGDATTPIPALYLALWGLGAGDIGRADTWIAQARARIAPLHNANLAAQLSWIVAERDEDARAVVRHAGAVLDFRPRAWQMRNARAHLLLTMQLREAAREELQQVDVSSIDHRKLAMSVADRAALGDVAGAQAVFDRAQAGMDVPDREFLRGRIAWSRGDLPAARDAFVAAIAAGEKRARFSLLQRALIHAGVLELKLDRPREAIGWFERAHASAAQSQSPTDRIDTALLLAQLRSELGESAQVRVQLADALAVSRAGDGTLAMYVELFVARLAPDLLPATLPAPTASAGAALLAARLAFDAGRRDEAGQHLDQAIAAGVATGQFADEMRLLQAQLGRAVAAELPLDPPFPPQSRHATRQVLARLGTAAEPANH